MIAFLFLAIGAVVGTFTRVIVSDRGMGKFGDSLTGIIGALAGRSFFGPWDEPTYNFWGSLLLAVLGAAIFVYVGGLLREVYDPPKFFNN